MKSFKMQILEHDIDVKFEDNWEWVGEGFKVKPDPTHWMHLPEPPLIEGV